MKNWMRFKVVAVLDVLSYYAPVFVPLYLRAATWSEERAR